MKTLVCVIGPPGCGKNFQLENLRVAGIMPATYLSSGDTFRKAQESDPELWEKVRPYLTGQKEQGKRLVPDEILWEVMDPQITQARGLVFLNGIPRTPSQMEHILSYSASSATRLVVLSLHASYERCLARIADRRAKEGRVDDADKDARERMSEFRDATIPALRKARECGVLREVDVGGGPNESHLNCLRVLADVLPEYRQQILPFASAFVDH